MRYPENKPENSGDKPYVDGWNDAIAETRELNAGETMTFTKPELQEHFRTLAKEVTATAVEAASEVYKPRLEAAYGALTKIREHADRTGDAALQQLLTSLGIHA